MKMRNLIRKFIGALFCCLCIGLLSSCTEKYTARYTLEACSMQSAGVEYTKKYVSQKYTAYFALSDAESRTIDGWIDRFSEYSSLLIKRELTILALIT